MRDNSDRGDREVRRMMQKQQRDQQAEVLEQTQAMYAQRLGIIKAYEGGGWGGSSPMDSPVMPSMPKSPVNIAEQAFTGQLQERLKQAQNNQF